MIMGTPAPHAEWTPLWPLLEPTIRDRQPDGFRWPHQNAEGWTGPLHSPLRDDRHPSFSIQPDTATDPGAWKDHATGEHGSMAELAERLGIDPRQSIRHDPQPGPENTLCEFCRRRKLDMSQLWSEWRVREAIHKNRPALRYPTSTGVDRVKYLDGKRPKCVWVESGGRAHWYGIDAALKFKSGPLYIVNGEPSVWACSQAGVPAVCMCAGEGVTPSADMIQELREAGFRNVRVVFDLDDAGREGGRRVADTLRAAGIDAVALELPAHLGPGADVDDLHRLVGDDDLAERLAELPELHDHAPASVDEWSEPEPLPAETCRVPPLPPELLPQSLRPWLQDEANRAAVPLEMVAVPAIVAFAAVVGRTVGIRPEERDDWTVVPNLWGAVVARPGTLKTHCVSTGIRPLRRIEESAREQHAAEADKIEAKRLLLESDVTHIKKAVAKSGGEVSSEAELARLLRQRRELELTPKRYTTSDATVEKLGELLQENPRGLLLTRDEVAGWLRTLDRPGREGDREFYLEGWNGTGSFTVDRIGRGSIHVPAVCISIVGGIQPGKLRPYIAEAVDGGRGADGLLQRVQLLVWPDGLGEWHKPEQWPDQEAYGHACEVYERLDGLDPAKIGARQEGHDPVPWVRFDSAAQELFDEWRGELESRLRGSELASTPAYEAHVAKYRSLMPTLALLFELAEWAGSSVSSVDGVSLRSTQHAAAMVDYLDAHARKLYAAELQPGLAAAHALLAKIRRGAVQDEGTIRDIYRHEWAGLTTAESVAAAVDALEERGWVRVSRSPAGSSGGRPSEVLHLHPSLREGDS